MLPPRFSVQRDHASREPDSGQDEDRPEAGAAVTRGSLVIGAMTVAGIGLGLVTVVLGAAVIGAVAEVVLLPSLLLKVAGGLAGGGIGLARGVKTTDQKKK